jgi:hypothetical protein
MMISTRREALMGALAVPAVTGLPKWRWQHGETSLVVYDPALERAAARCARLRAGGETLAIDGDRIRFGASLFERRPALVVGVTRPPTRCCSRKSAREAGYRPVDWNTETCAS